jgi:hypothetical protein
LEGEGLAVREIEQLGATLTERFEIDGARVQEPPRVDELDLRAPRLAPSASLEAAFSTDPYDQAAHTYGRSFRDLVRAFRRDYGHRTASASLRLRNCPFQPLAARASDLVCGINHAFLTGFLDGLGASAIQAVLEPQAGECCVELRTVT